MNLAEASSVSAECTTSINAPATAPFISTVKAEVVADPSSATPVTTGIVSTLVSALYVGLIAAPITACFSTAATPSSPIVDTARTPATDASTSVTVPTTPVSLIFAVDSVSVSGSNVVISSDTPSSATSTLDTIPASGEAPPKGITTSVLSSALAPSFVNVRVCASSSTTGFTNAPTTGMFCVVVVSPLTETTETLPSTLDVPTP